jgi:hypothetical protein
MCHQPGGTGQGRWDVRTATPLSLTGLMRGLLNNDEGDPANRLITPGDLARSMVHARITRLDGSRMPPVGSSVVDAAGAALLARWITNSLAGWQSYADWQLARFGAVDAPLSGPGEDYDGDRAVNWLEYLTGTDPRNPVEAWGISTIATGPAGVGVTFPQIANRRFVLEATDRLEPGAVWTPIWPVGDNLLIAASDTLTTAHLSAPETTRFYRVRVEEP